MHLEEIFQAAVCVLLPFFGTSFGAAAVFFLGCKHRPGLQRGLLGFSAGVMLAAMVWSLLQPAIDMANGHWLPATVGFLLGIWCLLGLDSWLSHIKKRPDWGGMLSLAVTLHNLPEGMAVGVALASMLAQDSPVTLAGTAALSLGIAIQNLPEGAIISAPLAAGGMSRGRAFCRGVLSGTVEPLGAVLTLALTRQVTLLLPYMLAFAAGSMLYVVVVELIPETQSGDNRALGPVCVALGFALMMALDVALSG